MAAAGRGSGGGGHRPREQPSARLFLALDLPPAERSLLAAWRDRAIATRSDLRAVAADALHLTLVFLGQRPAAEASRIAQLAFAAAAELPAARLVATAVVPLPRRAPRLFALDLEDDGGGATAIQAAISDALAAAGLHTPERRPFWPHVTLARVKAGAGAPAGAAKGRGRHAGRPHARVEPIDLEPPPTVFAACDVTLYQSHLSPHGARYEPLERLRLRARTSHDAARKKAVRPPV